MNRSREARSGTLALLKQWALDTHRHEKIIRAVWWRNPVYKILGLSKAALEERLKKSLKELGRRYQGVLYEILEGAGVAEELRVVSHMKIWQITQAWVRRNPQPWSVPGLLWASCGDLSSPGKALPERLKRKLMLRAFIEEVPDCRERRELLRLAYESQGEAFQALGPDHGVLESLSAVYPVLCEVLRKADRLVIWSDRALLPEDIDAMIPPYADFEEWLFEVDEVPGGSHVN
jgi:hypothetical protein